MMWIWFSFSGWDIIYRYSWVIENKTKWVYAVQPTTLIFVDVFISYYLLTLMWNRSQRNPCIIWLTYASDFSNNVATSVCVFLSTHCDRQSALQLSRTPLQAYLQYSWVYYVHKQQGYICLFTYSSIYFWSRRTEPVVYMSYTQTHTPRHNAQALYISRCRSRIARSYNHQAPNHPVVF